MEDQLFAQLTDRLFTARMVDDSEDAEVSLFRDHEERLRLLEHAQRSWPRGVTVKEAAEIMRCSLSQVYRQIREGRLRTFHVGPRAVRIAWKSLCEYVNGPEGEWYGPQVPQELAGPSARARGPGPAAVLRDVPCAPA